MVISSFLRDSFSANGNHKLSFCLCGFVSSGSGHFVNENSWKEGVSAKRGWDVAGPELTTVSQLALAPFHARLCILTDIPWQIGLINLASSSLKAKDVIKQHPRPVKKASPILLSPRLSDGTHLLEHGPRMELCENSEHLWGNPKKTRVLWP